MVADLIRDTAFGHVIRLITHRKVFAYPEENDPRLLERYIDQEKSKHLKQHGTKSTEANEDGHDSDTSSRTDVPDANLNISNTDPEKGSNGMVVDWDGPDDPQVITQHP
jgi:MFS transporter, DHA1 family, multidrug resistance protein